MAEAIRIHKCTICWKNFTKPQILQCFHTFCKECLDRHIQEHAQLNMFNCPICRREIEVPDGEDKGCNNNIYIDLSNQSKKHYCVKHKKKEIEFYCRDCCVAACGSCCMTSHTTHTVVDLPDVDKEYRIKVTSSSTTFEKRILQLKGHKQLLQIKSASIMTSAATTCNNIDIQVQQIYAEAKSLGAKLKEDATQLRDTEIEKLQKVMDDEDSVIAQLQTAVDCSSKSGISTQSLIDIYRGVATLSKDTNNLSTDVPVVKHPYFQLRNINIKAVKHQLGELQIMDGLTFTARFKPEEITMTGVNYDSEGSKIQGVPWHVYVKRSKEKSKFSIVLRLQNVEDMSVKAYTADHTFKLLHKTDDSKSIVKTFTKCVYHPGGGGWAWQDSIDWNELADPTNGFLDHRRFTIQATVTIIDVET